MKKLMGIDYGGRRVGLAMTDEAGRFAIPFAIIENSSSLVEEVADICRINGVEGVILGESRDWQGKPNLIMKRVEHFKAKLEERAGLPVIFEPEFLTSAEAERIQGKIVGLDASAAALILKSYLDRVAL